LLHKGVNPDGIWNAHPLEAALSAGRAEVITALLESGADKYRLDRYGDTILHRFISSDVRRPSGKPSIVDPAHQAAIAAVIDGGFDLTAKNQKGETCADLATKNPETGRNFVSAVALAGGNKSILHKAVREDNLAALDELLAKGNNINELDVLLRTPLTLALQLNRWAIAERLLLKDAEISYLPRSPAVLADIEYADRPKLVTAFRLRLLRSQLLHFDPDKGLMEGANASVAQFGENQKVRIPDAVWTVTCV
jgi:ankyrin repeat protein